MGDRGLSGGGFVGGARGMRGWVPEEEGGLLSLCTAHCDQIGTDENPGALMIGWSTYPKEISLKRESRKTRSLRDLETWTKATLSREPF